MDNNQVFAKILVPVDGSEPSFHAALIASNIASKFNAEITLLYVVVSPAQYEYINLTGLVTPKQIDKIIQNVKEESKDWFNKIEERIKKEKPNIKLFIRVKVFF